jgi:hypothetical protein
VERVEHPGLGLPVYLQADNRLGENALVILRVGFEDLDELARIIPPHLHYRVEHEVDRVPLAVYPHPGRVHEERHVVCDDLYHGVGGLPPVLIELRVVHPDFGLAGRPLFRERPVTHGRPVHVDWGTVRQVLGGDPGVVLPHELLDLRHLILCQLLTNASNDPIKKLVLDQHRYAPPWFPYPTMVPNVAARRVHFGKLSCPRQTERRRRGTLELGSKPRTDLEAA